MRKLVLFLLFVSSSMAGLAQNFVPATIEYPGGEIITAEIDFKDWNITPAQVQARIEGQEKILTPLNTKSIIVGNQKYLSAKVDLDISPFRKHNLLFGPDRQISSDTTIFLEALVEGSPSLFYHHDPTLKQHYFARLADGRFLELIDQWYYNGNRTRTVNKPLYSGQVKGVSVEYCPELLAKAGRVTYHRKSLIHFFTQLNQCQGITPALSAAQKDDKFSLLIKGGVTLHQLKIADVFSEFSPAIDAIDEEISPLLGLSFEYTLPWAHERFGIGFETYFNFKQSYYAEQAEDPDKTRGNETYQVREKPLIENHATNNDVLRMGVSGKYKLSKEANNPWFISAGIHTDFITFKSTMNYYYYYLSTNGNRYPIYKTWYNQNALVLTGINVSLSKEFGRFMIEANAYVNQSYTRHDPHHDYKAYLSGMSLRTGFKVLR